MPNLIDHKYHAQLSTIGLTSADSLAQNIPASSCCTIKARISLYEATPAGGGFEITANYVRGSSGGPVLVGAILSVITAQLSATLATAAATFVISGNTILVRVTGIALLTIKWGIKIEPLIHTPI